MFAGKAGAYPRVNQLKAYYENPYIAPSKSFIVQAPGVINWQLISPLIPYRGKLMRLQLPVAFTQI